MDSVSAPLSDAPAPTPAPLDWRPLSAAARSVRSIAGAITGTVLSIPVIAFVLGTLASNLGLAQRLTGQAAAFAPAAAGIAITLALSLSGAVIGAWIGRLRWKRTRWKLDDVGLRVRRGLLWHAEVLVPRSRVQHLDIERGPLERQFTLATLVVHTAGTQTHALRLSGLDETDAVALRDALIPDATRHVDAL